VQEGARTTRRTNVQPDATHKRIDVDDRSQEVGSRNSRAFADARRRSADLLSPCHLPHEEHAIPRLNSRGPMTRDTTPRELEVPVAR